MIKGGKHNFQKTNSYNIIQYHTVNNPKQTKKLHIREPKHELKLISHGSTCALAMQ